jgi:hypothetical protein
MAEFKYQRLNVLPELLSKAITTEADVVEVFSDCIDQLKQIDTLLQAAERRFSKTLEEIDRHLRASAAIVERSSTRSSTGRSWRLQSHLPPRLVR